MTNDPIRLPPIHDTGEPDYLWDRSGAPDPEVARLESLLSGLRHRAPALDLPSTEPAPRLTIEIRAARPTRTPPRWPGRLAAAAMIGLALLAGSMCPRAGSVYQVAPVTGSPTLARSDLARPQSLHANRWVQTDRHSSARIQVAELGTVTVGPGSRIRVRPSPEGRRLLDLQRGSIHAFITAPPRIFMVDTPAARAIDLGCEYTLTVDESGAGRLEVHLGYVELAWQGLRSIVPMNGGTCLTRPGRGPGTPFFDDAPNRLKSELSRFDFDGGGAAALNAVLSEARRRDALSLWHLLQRADVDLRGGVYDRLSQLKPPPEGVSRTGILALDRQMLATWWDDMRPF